MKITVVNVYSDSKETFQGEPEQIRAQLNARFPFLARYNNQSLQADLTKLGDQQAYMVNVE